MHRGIGRNREMYHAEILVPAELGKPSNALAQIRALSRTAGAIAPSPSPPRPRGREPAPAGAATSAAAARGRRLGGAHARTPPRWPAPASLSGPGFARIAP